MPSSAYINQWDPAKVTLDDESVDEAWKSCVLQGVFLSENEYNGGLGARISSIFVIFIVATAFTLFPVISKKVKWLKVPYQAYMFARYFGTGVIVATSFIHLMDPAYGAIGGSSCVAGFGNWSLYAFCPAIMLASAMFIFLVDVYSNTYVQMKYGTNEHDVNVADLITTPHVEEGKVHEHSKDSVDEVDNLVSKGKHNSTYSDSDEATLDSRHEFRKQISAFLILEFGVIFHSVMIGLNLGAVGDEFKTLYIVLVFHQAFEGLGIGARLSAIPIPDDKRWLPYFLCLSYGFTTPIAIAIGLGVRTTYNAGSYTANVVSGVLDAISAGILLYTGFVELLARDFIFDVKHTGSLKQLNFNILSLLFGTGIMALLGKWA